MSFLQRDVSKQNGRHNLHGIMGAAVVGVQKPELLIKFCPCDLGGEVFMGRGNTLKFIHVAFRHVCRLPSSLCDVPSDVFTRSYSDKKGSCYIFILNKMKDFSVME